MRVGERLRRAAVVLAAALVAGWAAQPAAAAFTKGQRAALARATRATMASSYFSGIAVGLWTPKGRYVHAFGRADAAKRRPLRLTDRFRVGSITKTFTATVVLQLVQEGALSLTQPLSDFEPEVPNARAITIQNLLNHTSGLPDLPDSLVQEVVSHPHRALPFGRLLLLAIAQPFTPIGIYSYANTNYLLLGRIVEKRTGISMAEQYRRRVFRPLRLRATTFAPGTRLPAPHAHGYVYDGYRRVDTSTWTGSYLGPAGAMVSTLADLRRYAPALATGRGLLDAATQKLRLTLVPTGLPNVGYGLGIMALGSFLGHDGQILGYNAIELYSPSLRTTLVALGTTSPDLLDAPGSFGTTMDDLAEALVAIAYPQRQVRFPHRVAHHPGNPR